MDQYLLTTLLPSGEKHTLTSLKWAIPKKMGKIKMNDKKHPMPPVYVRLRAIYLQV
jgi:hypothetical protein